ncbi:hypothetical protein D6855_14190 [Butyrivibrio sp. CB08]|uniref:hypothetical protein n=1 Tax=Butyrivibrio sp. CB08 TaxID=2364879 RepID=UPI000EA9FCB8|nr:hypothetical protein [Butyrivibrio sp. CB08]RKM56814.1 hypothetical protein D6855_14190 [Butyrivibrio sp. CB08]
MANDIDFGAMVQQMRDAGVRILTDKSELELSEAYVILGSRSSVRYLQGEADGINGYVVLCAEDEVDMNRLCSALDKPYYDTDDEKRPYKVPFEVEELQKVINILKMNSLNVASVERSVNKTDIRLTAEKHTRARIPKKSAEERGPMKWVVSANAGFDTIRAFGEMRTLDWKQYNCKFKVDDIVYIYFGLPDQKIRLKCKVVKADLPHTEIDDRKYIIGIEDYELEYEYEPFYETTMQLTVLAEFVESDLFGFGALAEHGVKGTIRSPRTITGKVLEYIDSIDVPENIKNNFEE